MFLKDSSPVLTSSSELGSVASESEWEMASEDEQEYAEELKENVQTFKQGCVLNVAHYLQ